MDSLKTLPVLSVKSVMYYYSMGNSMLESWRGGRARTAALESWRGGRARTAAWAVSGRRAAPLPSCPLLGVVAGLMESQQRFSKQWTVKN